MCKSKRVKNEFLISKHLSQALKMELNSDAGKINLAFTLISLFIGFLVVCGEGATNAFNTVMSACKFNVIYEPKTDFTALYIALGAGIICFLLMVFIVENQRKLKEQLDEIRSKNSENAS